MVGYFHRWSISTSTTAVDILKLKNSYDEHGYLSLNSRKQRKSLRMRRGFSSKVNLTSFKIPAARKYISSVWLMRCWSFTNRDWFLPKTNFCVLAFVFKFFLFFQPTRWFLRATRPPRWLSPSPSWRGPAPKIRCTNHRRYRSGVLQRVAGHHRGYTPPSRLAWWGWPRFYRPTDCGWRSPESNQEHAPSTDSLVHGEARGVHQNETVPRAEASQPVHCHEF